MPRETRYEKIISKRLRAVGAVNLNVHGHAFQRAGWPDHYVCHRLFRGWIEFKAGEGRLSTLQRIVVQDLRERGDVVLIVRFLDPGRYEIGGQILEFNEVWMEIEEVGTWIESCHDGLAILEKFAAAERVLRERGVIWDGNRHGRSDTHQCHG